MSKSISQEAVHMKRNGNYSVKLKTIVEAHDLHPLHLSKD